MNFVDAFFSQADRFSLGEETESGRLYLSIPVSNGPVDYEEYFELTPDEYEQFLADRKGAADFAEVCRLHLEDERLIQKPGRNRGTPV